jgi:thiamine pyrophosphate-dependent acetolactate synthase large subunit-like protein
MAEVAADILLDTIHRWGVEVVFGLPGDGINGIMEALRKRQDKVRFDLQPIDFAAFARACGGKGYTIDDPESCGAILEDALREPGPVIIEAVVDPHEPPLPPKITLDQAKKFAESLARGTPHGGKIALTVLADRIRELV